jgi:ubiquinone/menaquinone biosynthesis C-methylase UbiE
MNRKNDKTQGWEKVADWYNSLTGTEGHYYHKEIIIPKLISFLESRKTVKILDLASGQGVLERALHKEIDYCGVDISPSLIRQAQEKKKGKSHRFIVADAASPEFSLPEKNFDAVTVILALQDIKDPLTLFQNASGHLKNLGTMILVMNHPAFRIPRQSSWNIDEKNKIQSRDIRGYMSSFEIPISVRPGQGEHSEQVVYHHHSLSAYSGFLRKAGFFIEEIEEWVSNKQSTGSKAKMENRARKEFPLFLCCICRKIDTSILSA